MASQKELDRVYMEVAESFSKLSKGIRAKVGACIVTKHGVLIGGCNGMAPGSENQLEYLDEHGNLVSKEHVLHAELNAILKAAKEGVSVVGGTLYVTLSPCLKCSEMIAASGIDKVVYKNEYRLACGIENLKKLNLKVEKHDD
jgi:dCMP deaminase